MATPSSNLEDYSVVSSNTDYWGNATPFYQDKTGNIWDSKPKFDDNGNMYGVPNLVLSSDVANNPYVQKLGIQNALDNPQALQDAYNSGIGTFYNQVGSQLENQIFGKYQANQNFDEQNSALQELKNVDPNAYAQNQAKLLGHQAGWQIGQNTADRNVGTSQAIQDLTPQLQSSGMTQNQINALVNNSINQGSQINQQYIANAGAQGNFWKNNIIGALKVGSLALGAGALDGAFAGAGALGTEISSEAGQQAFFNALASGASSSDAMSAGLAADAASLGTNAALQGPTYQELGVTGLDSSGIGPSYGEMGFNGLNQGEAIASADSASQLASIKNGLSTANDIRKGVSTANSLAKMLSQSAGSGLSTSLGKLAQGQNPVASTLPSLVRGNQNPFAYTAQAPIQNAQPTYISSLANLLKQG